MIKVKDFQANLHLEALNEFSRREMDIEVTDINRPGMQFCGFYEYFAYERPQVIGKTEMAYLCDLPEDVRLKRLQQYFSYGLPALTKNSFNSLKCQKITQHSPKYEHGKQLIKFLD